MKNTSNDSLTLCQTFFYHSEYYCDDCNWANQSWFFIIQFLLAVTVLLSNSVSIIWCLHEAIKQHRLAESSNNISDGRSYWISCCFTGLLFGVGQTAESVTLACAIGPSKWGDWISSFMSHLATKTGLLVEVVCSCKLVLGTMKRTLFQSFYPTLRLILVIWGIIPITVASTAVIKYNYNSTYMVVVKPVANLQLIMMASVVCLLISASLYTIKLMSKSRRLGTVIYLSDESKKRNRNLRLRLRFHLTVLAVIAILYLVCTIFYFVAKSSSEVIDPSVCMVWMVPYKSLSIIYAMGKSVVVVWELWCKQNNRTTTKNINTAVFYVDIVRF